MDYLEYVAQVVESVGPDLAKEYEQMIEYYWQSEEWVDECIEAILDESDPLQSPL